MKKFAQVIKHLPRTMFNILLTFSASSYIIVVFLIKEGISFPVFPNLDQCIFYIVLLIVPVFIAGICIKISKHLPTYSMECEIKEVELASHSFLPNYLGYFFVALSIPNIETFLFIYVVIFVFVHLSQALSFNPLFLLFKYQFYFITGEDGTRIFLITRQEMKSYKDVDLGDLRKINDFTFIDMR